MKDEWREFYISLLNLIDEQAKDEGLWHSPMHASEAYLQFNLREIHKKIEEFRELMDEQ